MARGKRPRVDTPDDDVSGASPLHDGATAERGGKEGEHFCSLLLLPNEVLVSIMKFFSFSEVAETQRLVCRRFAEVAAIVLIGGMYRVGAELKAAMVTQEITMESSTTDNEMVISTRAFCALEFAHMQWRLVEATLWRHGAAAFAAASPGAARACCLGARLFDHLREVCRLSRVDPLGLGWSFRYDAAYRSASARRRLAHDAKRFLNVFEKYVERRLNAGPRACASKVVDLLFCLHDEKSVEVSRGASGVDADTCLFRLRAAFALQRAWFTCLAAASPAGEHHPRERQRYMFLRVRRLVTACNESALERTHHERETLMRLHTPWGAASVASPFASKYAAFGHYADQFFFYGALNERAYDDRFRPQQEDPLLDFLLPHLPEEEGEALPAPRLPVLPAMEVVVRVRLVCPPALAPLAALRHLPHGDWDPLSLSEGPFALELDFACAASAENRLPSRFTWRVSDDDAGDDGCWLYSPAPRAPQTNAPERHTAPCVQTVS